MTGLRRIDPAGAEWVVRRRWVHRDLRWRGKRGTLDLLDGADLAAAGSDLPVVGGVLVAIAAILFVAGLVLFVLPLLLLVAELLLVAVVLGAGVAGRVLLGRPWTVEARRLGEDCAYEWKVTGWGSSRALVRSVADQLEATGIPTGGEPVSRGRRRSR
jgi:hypothetical protein